MKYSALCLVTGVLLAGCNSADESYTLYKVNLAQSSERLMVEVFSKSENSDDNLNACREAKNKIMIEAAKALEEGTATTTEKYWCEKGSSVN